MRPTSQPLWVFADLVDSTRSATLLAYESFEQIMNSLLGSFEIEAFHPEPARAPHLDGCRRASFLLTVPENLYDAFFNSPFCYRASYATDPSQGAKANRALIDVLTPSLTKYAISRGEAGSWAEKTLKGHGAKIWIYEDQVANQMGRSEPEILYPPWQSATDDGAGLLAPVGNKLEVKGGWINPGGTEVLDPHKAERSKEIHETGYT